MAIKHDLHAVGHAETLERSTRVDYIVRGEGYGQEEASRDTFTRLTNETVQTNTEMLRNPVRVTR